MILFLILCASIQTLRGASAAPTNISASEVIQANVSLNMTRESAGSPNEAGQRLRTVYEIAKSCLLTIVTCVWTSIHPNINAPTDPWWTCMKRKLITMGYAIIAPELVLYWALYQRHAAKRIAIKYNQEFAKHEEMKPTLWQLVVGWLRPLPKATTWRGDGQLWTITHGFFIQMGGFVLYDNGYPNEVLDYNRLEELLRQKCIDMPTVTERDLQDRSKGDAITKAIILLQTTWFVFQSIARRQQHLPLSELEVLTLAFSVLNVAIYAAWWNKPQGVNMAICIPLKSAEIGAAASITPPMSEETKAQISTNSNKFVQPELRHSNSNVPLVPLEENTLDKRARDRHIWLQRILRQDREQFNSPLFFPFRLLLHVMTALLRPLNKMDETAKFDKRHLRVPMFYTSDMGYSFNISIIGCLFGIVFGAIHLLAWGSEFPSHRDHVLWRVSAIIITMEPSLIVVTELLSGLSADGILTHLTGGLFLFLLPFYVVSRTVVIAIALKALVHPPYDVLLDIAWTTYIPHL